MKTGSREFRDHAYKYLRRAQRGQSTTIMHRGKPIARLVPIEQSEPDDFEDLLDQMETEGLIASRPASRTGNDGWLKDLRRVGVKLPPGTARQLLDTDREE